MSRENHIRRLQAALRVSRGWIITCSESAQARRDLNTVDKALAMTSTDFPPSTPVQTAAPTFNETGDALKVERIAAALVTVERAEHGLPPMRFDMLTEEGQTKYRNRARFVLATLTKDASHG